jgi:hypothetical protein
LINRISAKDDTEKLFLVKTKIASIMKTILLIFILTLTLHITGLSQITQEWVATYEEGIARALFIEADDSGSVIVTGQKGDDWLTLKYSSSGEALWEQGVVSFDDPTFPNDMALDRWGNAIIVGATKDSSWQYVWYAIKYDGASGQVFWEDQIENNHPE